jgi:archaellum component FlaC
MANDPDPETSVSVSRGEVRVDKTFEADRFPVPAIAFEIESLADDPIRVRLVDQIPESFAMEGVGFHPDYDSDNWTAYRDHRVAYERTLEPMESVLTVYGIRIDDPAEAESFLGEPSVELVEPDATESGSGDVLGRETTQVVRDALSGEGSDLADLQGDGVEPEPLLEDAEAEAADEAASTPAPRPLDADLSDAMGERDASVTAVDGDDPAAEGRSPDEPSGETGADPRPAAVDADPADEADRNSPAAAPGSVAAALAAEIRAGSVDDDDLAVIEDALEREVPTSVDVRLGRLQSRVEDVLAYRDALADFLDENGTAEELLEGVNEDVSDLQDRVDDIDDELATADSERAALGDDLDSVSASVADLDQRIGDVEDDLAALDDRLDRLDERLADTEALADDVASLEDELVELRSFRDRLSSAFGPGEE